MRYKAKSVAALQTVLGGSPDQALVEVDPDIWVSAKTVGELRKLTAWPENKSGKWSGLRTDQRNENNEQMAYDAGHRFSHSLKSHSIWNSSFYRG